MFDGLTMPPARSPAIAPAPKGVRLREWSRLRVGNLRNPALCPFTKREWAATFTGMTSPANPQPAPKARITARKITIDLTIMTGIGIVLAFIGPFGSFAEPLAFRLVSWVGFAWLGYAIYSPINAIADRLSEALDLPRVFTWGLTVTLATVPMAIAVYLVSGMPGPYRFPSLQAATEQYFYVWIVGGGITAFFYLIEGRHAPVASATTTVAAMEQPSGMEPQVATPEPLEPAVPEPAPNPLLDALPAELGSDIIALEMEDHYVRVHTALGSELVLMRLRDAMVHVADIEGRQTHRSWWVARGAVEDAQRDGRNVRLVLARGIEAPVSRAQVSELKEAGWI
ncbi:MAG: LytTR family DNA-binding domain-containing protein [Pseudomonadota bacterium]